MSAPNLSLKVNGTTHGHSEIPSREDALVAFDHVLRAIALSDSPVLVEGGSRDARKLIAERLHLLGRRASQPLRVCKTEKECRPLVTDILDGDTNGNNLGTWVLRGVTEWPIEKQVELGNMLDDLDQARFHGGIKHEKVPRVIVLLSEDEEQERLAPQLQTRLSFFHISLSLNAKGAAL